MVWKWQSQISNPKVLNAFHFGQKKPLCVPKISPEKVNWQSQPSLELPSTCSPASFIRNGLPFLSLFMTPIYWRQGINITVNQARRAAISSATASLLHFHQSPEITFHPAHHTSRHGRPPVVLGPRNPCFA